MILDDDMAGEGAIVGKNHVVSDDAIMRDVGIGEKVVVASDDRFRIRRGAAIHRAEFAKAIVVADLEKRRLAAILRSWRALADGADRERIGWPAR